MTRFLVTMASWVLVLGCATTEPVQAMAPRGPLETAVWPFDKVEVKKFDWGELRLCHFTAETYGTKDTLVGYVVLSPGKENHAPHQHAEEEFMEITEGEGTWHLNGKDLPAKKGDVVYAAPWDFHGLTNTGTAPLTFFVVKWGSKGLKAPEKPASK
ncbi:MAG: cupin domain-containing protein [Planctomycetaceae bacterium]|nr:cupin domain-containing protein [Planctomycetaceae bacterium]